MLSDKDAIELAKEAIRGKADLSAEATPVVKRESQDVIVTFVRKNPPGFRGPDFDARVTIDCQSRKVKEILGGD